MPIIGTILIIIAGIFVILVLAGIFISSSFSFSRTAEMSADRKVIFNIVDDLHTWKTWSAWSPDNDPAIKIEYEGKEKGVGAMMKWKGKKMGNGNMEVVSTDPYKTIEIVITFNRGLFRINSSFTFEEKTNGGTIISWTMKGKTKRSTIAKILGRQLAKLMAKDMEIAFRLLQSESGK